jgi:site-specific DNA-methyltransferase (adenine-specific)
MAARYMGRRAIGIELDEHHCETTSRRFDQMTLF